MANATKGAAECGFAVAGVEGVFALAQCWGTLDKGTCERCLNAAGTRVQECVPNAQGRSLFTGCFLRYSTRKFYNDVALHGIKDSTNSRGTNLLFSLASCVTESAISSANYYS